LGEEEEKGERKEVGRRGKERGKGWKEGDTP